MIIVIKKELPIGQKFGRLTLVEDRGIRGGLRWVLCQCDCGVVKEYQWQAVRRGNSQSCSCLRTERVAKAHMTHGHAANNRSPEYRAWLGMKERCYNVNSPAYKDYGDRGILIADEWLASFETFLAAVGRRPSSRHSLDRINNDGNYEPQNTRWATRAEQNGNRRGVVMVTIDGVEKHIAGWCREFGIFACDVLDLRKSGMSPSEAIQTERSRVRVRRKLTPLVF